jgi:hypothetical protein
MLERLLAGRGRPVRCGRVREVGQEAVKVLFDLDDSKVALGLDHDGAPLDDSFNPIEVGGSFIGIPLRRAAATPPAPRSLYAGRNFSRHFALLRRFLLLCYRSA